MAPLNLCVKRREIYAKESSSEIQTVSVSRKKNRALWDGSILLLFCFVMLWKVISTSQSIIKDFLPFPTFRIYCSPLKWTRYLSGFLLHEVKLLSEEINHLTRSIAPKTCLLKIPLKRKALRRKLKIWIENHHWVQENSLFPPSCVFSAGTER